MEWSKNELPFLDVLVKLRNNRLITDVYSKPTDMHQHLDYKSCHPEHIKKGIRYGQALRLRRICDSDEVFEERLNEMKGHFTKRGFKHRFVESQFTKAKKNRIEIVSFVRIELGIHLRLTGCLW